MLSPQGLTSLIRSIRAPRASAVCPVSLWHETGWECAQDQGDRKLGEGFSEVLRQGRFASGLARSKPLGWRLPTFHPKTKAQFVCQLAEKVPTLANTAVTSSGPWLATFWHRATAELVPLTPVYISTAIHSLKKIASSSQTGSFKQLTVKEVLLNGLVATELWMWFYVSEISGKRGLTDYNIWRPIFNLCLSWLVYLFLFFAFLFLFLFIIWVFLDHQWSEWNLNF